MKVSKKHHVRRKGIGKGRVRKNPGKSWRKIFSGRNITRWKKGTLYIELRRELADYFVVLYRKEKRIENTIRTRMYRSKEEAKDAVEDIKTRLR